LLDDVHAADVQLRTGYLRKAVTLDQLLGDVCEERSFQRMESAVGQGTTWC